MKDILMRAFLLGACLFVCPFLFAQKSMSVVFRSGENGYHTFRIPAIIKDPKGNLIAFCEGRTKGSGDFGNIDIVMRKSNDKGRTWSDLKIIVDAEDLQAGNPAPVVDMRDSRFPGGRIFLFYNTGNNHENEIRKGNGIREVWYKTSTDGGDTWSAGVNITMQVHFPLSKISDSAHQENNLHQANNWRSYANTPGHAIQLMNKSYKGRIYIAANHSAGEPKKDFSDYQAHGFYSDDHGASFHVSSNVSILGSNESSAVELFNGRLMMNSRNQRGDIKARIVSVSSNGGESWDTSYFDQQLPDPVNEGSILQLVLKKNRHALAFSNAANETKRDSLTLRISYDDGRSWPEKILIDQNNIQNHNDFTAYSDLVQLNQRVIGILYERNNYKEIVFKKQKWH